MDDFMEVDVITADNTISTTAFQFLGQTYVIITSNISTLLHGQAVVDRIKGYDGPLLPYETMLFRGPEGDESVSLYPFGDLPGHQGIGVFQRYDNEDEARDGHQHFVTRVKNELRKRAMSKDVGQQPMVKNADTFKIILGINAAIQGRDAKLTLNDKPVMCVALDGTCTFDTKEVDEIMLTTDQLIDLAEQALEHSVKHKVSRFIDKRGNQSLMIHKKDMAIFDENEE